jgi:hypothetical protein
VHAGVLDACTEEEHRRSGDGTEAAEILRPAHRFARLVSHAFGIEGIAQPLDCLVVILTVAEDVVIGGCGHEPRAVDGVAPRASALSRKSPICASDMVCSVAQISARPGAMPKAGSPIVACVTVTSE